MLVFVVPRKDVFLFEIPAPHTVKPLKLILSTELRVALLEVEERVVDALGGGVCVPPPALAEAAELGVHLNTEFANHTKW